MAIGMTHRFVVASALLPAAAAAAQTTPAPATPGDPQLTTATPRSPTDNGDIIVTARQRRESLKDIPVAVSAVSGATIKEQQLVTVKDVQAFAPGLNINSDSIGRAFVSIRGIGTTFIDTVQPGVGIFIDGIYQPNTTYLNSPLTDVERVEVLRGPQGTLFGNNTLGGAINVITRQPTNQWQGRVDGSLASGDNFGSASASVSGPIIDDKLLVRIGAAYHTQDGFMYNTLLGNRPSNPLRTKTLNGSVIFTPVEGAKFTANGGYDRVSGGSVPYEYVSGTHDFHLGGASNVPSLGVIDYYTGNLKGEFDADRIRSKITAVGAYNRSDTTSIGDGDFGPINFLVGTNDRTLKTYTGELRVDTKWNEAISTLVGAFVSRATTNQFTTTTIPLLGIGPIPATGNVKNRNVAGFATAFVKLAPSLDLQAGIRFDHQRLTSTTRTALAEYKNSEWQPRVSLTKRWTPDLMTYISAARGARGGGQNEPRAPNVLFRGDSVWTYEAGTKMTAFDRRLSLDVAAFYNDYKNFIGPNALAPAAGGGAVAINLNAGTVHSYGVEAEASLRLSEMLRFYGNATYLHARVVNSDQFLATTGYAYPGDRLPFTPDVNFTVGGNAKYPLAADRAIVADVNYVYKGRRDGLSLNADSVSRMPSYGLVNASLTLQTKLFDLGVFATNLNNAKYQETYLDSSELGRAGLGAPFVQNLAIQGVRRRIGMRGTVRF